MDKNKLATIAVAIIWLAIIFAKSRGFITMSIYRILLLALAGVYALYYYRRQIFGKK
jgi:hypothetical protein